jgi:UDP-2-acetamido-3-amino-2,3-dideoxy-glucuronate N-acetyltransferase
LSHDDASVDGLEGVYVHPSATVDPGARIGKGTKIWHYCHVMAGARIGQACILGQNVFVGGSAVIGNNVKIQNNVSVYDAVELEDEVFCGPSMVFTNVITPRVVVNRKGAYVPTRVGRGATLGANCTVVCGNWVGELAVVGAGAVVTRDVPAHGLMMGVPARRVGWACWCGIPLLDDLTCPECGREYEPKEASIVLTLEPS